MKSCKVPKELVGTETSCGNCNTIFQIKPQTAGKYCSRSCAVTVNNRLSPKRVKAIYKCSVLGCSNTRTELPSGGRSVFCSVCFSLPSYRRYAFEWLAGYRTGGRNHLAPSIRLFLLEESNFSCCKCGYDTPHPADGRPILEINHINGDGTDHRFENLEVLCPNCHALTDSYRGRNAGHGRPVSYLRIDKSV